MTEPTQNTEPATPYRTALITGASRGIGRAIAAALGSRQFNVTVNYLGNVDAANETATLVEDAGGKAIVVQADVSDTADHEKLVDRTLEAFGRIDLLVNNAGIPPKYRADILEATEEGYDRVIDTNLRGPFFLTQRVAKQMLAQEPLGGDHLSTIINMASLSSYAATHERSQYCIAKAGLSMMTDLYAARLAPKGILVLEIRPGIINTDMARNAKEKYDKLIFEGDLLPMKRWGEPEDIAKAVLAITDGCFNYSPGAVLDIDGGFNIRRL